jgi:hypothetical protein
VSTLPKHPEEFQHGDSRMLYVPVRLHWRYRGLSGMAEHQAIASPSEDGTRWELSDYQWFEGNYACDCNRGEFIGLTAEQCPGLFHLPGSFYGDGSGPVEEAHRRCGDEIILTRVESLRPEVESLEGEMPIGGDPSHADAIAP